MSSARMRALAFGFVAFVAALGACSSFSADPGGGDAGAPDSGAPAEDAAPDTGAPVDATPGIDAAIYELNPYGKPYPTKYIGTGVRNGDAAGYVIANFKLTGYKVGSSKVETIPLAQFYDPEGRTHSTVVLITCGRWDTYSKQMLKALNDAPALPSRIALVSVLAEGDSYDKAATIADLDAWRPQLASAVHVLDPFLASLKPIGELGIATPGSLMLDARTMEIVSANVGAQDPITRITAERDAIEARPPAY